MSTRVLVKNSFLNTIIPQVLRQKGLSKLKEELMDNLLSWSYVTTVGLQQTVNVLKFGTLSSILFVLPKFCILCSYF